MTPSNEGRLMQKIEKVEEHVGRFVEIVRWFLIREDKRREALMYQQTGTESANDRETPR